MSVSTFDVGRIFREESLGLQPGRPDDADMAGVRARAKAAVAQAKKDGHVLHVPAEWAEVDHENHQP